MSCLTLGSRRMTPFKKSRTALSPISTDRAWPLLGKRGDMDPSVDREGLRELVVTSDMSSEVDDEASAAAASRSALPRGRGLIWYLKKRQRASWFLYILGLAGVRTD